MSKDSTSSKSPWSSSTLNGAKSPRPAAWVAPELGSNWTRTVVSTSSGSAGRRGALEASPGQRIWGNDVVTVMSCWVEPSGTDSRALPLWERDSTASAGGTRSSSEMVAKALLDVPIVLKLSS